MIPNCVSYDPTYGHEVAVIIHDGLRRMVTNQEDVFYYITLMNENYEHPPMPRRRRGGHPEGAVPPQAVESEEQVAACSCSVPAPSCAKQSAAAQLLESDWGVAADVWSATSFTELRREGLAAERWNLLHPGAKPRMPYVDASAAEKGRRARSSPRATTSRASPSRSARSCRRAAPTRCSAPTASAARDSRARLRDFFEVNRHFVAVAALKSLADQGEVQAKQVAEAIKKYGIDPEKADPTTV